MKESDEDPAFWSPDGHDYDKYNEGALLTDDGHPVYHQDGIQWFAGEPPPRGWSEAKADPKRGTPTVSDVDDAIESLGSTDPDAVKAWLGNHHFDTNNIPQPDWSPYTNSDDVHLYDTGLADNFASWGGVKGPASVTPEPPDSQTFQSMIDAFKDVDDPIDLWHSQTWIDIAQKIEIYTAQFRNDFFGVTGWEGKTADAVKANVDAFTDLNPSKGPAFMLAKGIEGLSYVEHAFSEVMGGTKRYIMGNEQNYYDALKNWPQHHDEVVHDFDAFAHMVMTAYDPGIRDVVANNPAFSTGSGPDLNPSSAGDGPGGDDKNGPDNHPDLSNFKLPDFSKLKFPDLSSLDLKGPPGAKDLKSEPPPTIDTSNIPPPNFKDLNTEPPPDIKSLINGDTSGLQNGLGGGGADLTDPSGMPPPDAAALLPGGGQDLDPFTSGSGLSGQNVDPFSSGGGAAAGLSGLTGALGSAADAVTGPAGAAKSLLSDPTKSGSGALGPAANAAQQALDAATKGRGTPEGVPGLGPKGPNASNGSDGAHPGGGAGVGARGLDLSKPAGAPVAALNKGLGVPGATRIGMTDPHGAPASGGGQPSGGGGGGGQRGPNGKEHKTNKALRRKKNGEEIFGDIDAVVPVLGDDEPDKRAGGDDNGQQPAPTTVGGARRSYQPHHDPRFVPSVEPGRTAAGS